MHSRKIFLVTSQFSVVSTVSLVFIYLRPVFGSDALLFGKFILIYSEPGLGWALMDKYELEFPLERSVGEVRKEDIEWE